MHTCPAALSCDLTPRELQDESSCACRRPWKLAQHDVIRTGRIRARGVCRKLCLIGGSTMAPTLQTRHDSQTSRACVLLLSFVQAILRCSGEAFKIGPRKLERRRHRQLLAPTQPRLSRIAAKAQGILHLPLVRFQQAESDFRTEIEEGRESRLQLRTRLWGRGGGRESC